MQSRAKRDIWSPYLEALRHSFLQDVASVPAGGGNRAQQVKCGLGYAEHVYQVTFTLTMYFALSLRNKKDNSNKISHAVLTNGWSHLRSRIHLLFVLPAELNHSSCTKCIQCSLDKQTNTTKMGGELLTAPNHRSLFH